MTHPDGRVESFEPTYEPLSNVIDRSLVEEFEQRAKRGRKTRPTQSSGATAASNTTAAAATTATPAAPSAAAPAAPVAPSPAASLTAAPAPPAAATPVVCAPAPSPSIGVIEEDDLDAASMQEQTSVVVLEDDMDVMAASQAAPGDDCLFTADSAVFVRVETPNGHAEMIATHAHETRGFEVDTVVTESSRLLAGSPIAETPGTFEDIGEAQLPPHTTTTVHLNNTCANDKEMATARTEEPPMLRGTSVLTLPATVPPTAKTAEEAAPSLEFKMQVRYTRTNNERRVSLVHAWSAHAHLLSSSLSQDASFPIDAETHSMEVGPSDAIAGEKADESGGIFDSISNIFTGVFGP